MDDIINRSDQTSTNENIQTLLNEKQQEQISNNNETTTTGVIDFSFKINEKTEHSNRSRSLNTSNKSRSLKRKHPNGNIDHGGTISMPTRIFHADAFCGICRKVQIFEFYLKKKKIFFVLYSRNFVINIF